ncbi:MAG: glutaminyl-peptide cyclotransferase [Candidatus Kapaibacteriales bacterium]
MLKLTLYMLIVLISSCAGNDSNLEGQISKSDIASDNIKLNRDREQPEKVTISDKQGLRQVSVERNSYKLIDSIPHDPGFYTQGLSYINDTLFESTGIMGRSKLISMNPKSGKIYKTSDLPPYVFGEGNALVNDKMYLLSYKNSTAYVYGRGSFKVIEKFSYYGEGWGLTNTGDTLIMSNGTSTLTFRDSKDFSEIKDVQVWFNNQPLPMLNELEYVDGFVYANIYGEDVIVKIDPISGSVVRAFDFSPLRNGQAGNSYAEVLNGIAYNPKDSLYYIAGKFWNQIYIVKID